MTTRFEVIFILSIIGSLDYWTERRCDPRVMRIRFLPPQSMRYMESRSLQETTAEQNMFHKRFFFLYTFPRWILILLIDTNGLTCMSSRYIYCIYISSVCNCGNRLSYYIPSYIIFSLSLLQILIIQMYLSCHVCVISAMDCSDQSYPRNDEQVSYFSQKLRKLLSLWG